MIRSKPENKIGSFLVENCDSRIEFVAKKVFPLLDATIGRVDRNLKSKKKLLKKGAEKKVKSTASNLLPNKFVKKYRRRQNFLNQSILIFVLDSCRYDVFEDVYDNELPVNNVRKAYSTCTWTLPSHESIVRGILPFGDFVDPLADLDCGKGRRLTRFYDYSFASTAMPYLSENDVVDNDFHTCFDNYFNANKLDSSQTVLEKAEEFISKENNFFGLINFGETHLPYSNYNELTAHELLDKLKEGEISRDKAKEEQGNSVKNLLESIKEFRAVIPEDTLVIVTADHGDLLGESNGYGHMSHNEAVFNEKLFEVPLIYYHESAPRGELS